MKTTCLTAAAVFLALLAGCEEKKPQLAPVASAVEPTAPPPGAKVKKFVVDPAGKATIEMEAPKEKIKASATGAAGSVDVDASNLEASRGELKVDLTTLTTNTFGDPGKDGTQTTHARTWLEVSDGESGKLEDAVKEKNRWAVYAIRSVTNVSEKDLAKVAPVKQGALEVRTVTLTTKGDLLVHGHKVEREADLSVGFEYEPGAPADKPKALSITTKKPFRVVLAEHEVQPRDGFGKIATKSLGLLGTKVAENADIVLAFRAAPQS